MQAKRLFALVAVFALVGAGCNSTPEPDPVLDIAEGMAIADGMYVLDTENTTVEWYGSKVTGEHNGTIDAASGSIEFTEGVGSGEVVIDTTTIVALDLADNEDSQKSLENHLMSDDFFASEDYPEATLTVASLETLEERTDMTNARLTGTLTIKDITNDVSFDVLVETSEEGELHLTGSVELDRTEWDMRFGSAKFFENLGDAVVHDEFTVTIDATLEMEKAGDDEDME